MKYKIHFTHKGETAIDDVDDFFIVEGVTIEEIREKVKAEESKRNLDPDINNCFSEKIKW